MSTTYLSLLLGVLSVLLGLTSILLSILFAVLGPLTALIVAAFIIGTTLGATGGFILARHRS
jgi:hypothetical protein